MNMMITKADSFVEYSYAVIGHQDIILPLHNTALHVVVYYK